MRKRLNLQEGRARKNVSGDNIIEGNVSLRTTLSMPTAIGVAPDPDPFGEQDEPFGEFSQLTINGVIDDQTGGVSPVPKGSTYLKKLGAGELVLTAANTYTGPAIGRTPGVLPQTEIAAGWITVENDLALGARISTQNSYDPPVQVDAGAALVLKQDLNGNDLTLTGYNLVLNGSGITSPLSWLNQDGALLNLDGDNTINGYIYLNGAAGIGVELDGANAPTPPDSELTLSSLGDISGATIQDGASPGTLIKYGSQRLIIQIPGTYTGGFDLMGGVVRIQNDTALGAGGTVTVGSGTALELGTTLPQLAGGQESGLDITGENLILQGTGNPTFGDAPLTILQDDNAWQGNITLDSSIAITFDNQLGDEPLGTAGLAPIPGLSVNGASLVGGGSLTVNTSTPGSSSVNAAYTLTQSGTITGGSFSLTVTDPNGNSAIVGIPWSTSVPVLIARIQTALNALASTFGGTAAAGIATVATSSSIIEVAPNARFVVTGVIDDGSAASPAPAPADLTVAGGGELLLAGANTYRGTTYINQGIVTIANPLALGAGAIPEVQTLALAGAGTTTFTLSFNGAVTPTILYTGTVSDLATISNALNNLATIKGAGGNDVAGSVSVVQVGNVFTITFGGALAGFYQNAIVSSNPAGAFVTTITAGAGGTVVASGAQLQMQGGINVLSEPLEIQGQGDPANPDVQTVTVIGASGAFALSFTNPNSGVTSTTTGLPLGASAVQVAGALNQLASITYGNGSSLGSVLVNEIGVNVYQVTFTGSFVGASNLPLIAVAGVTEQIVAVTGTTGSFTLNFPAPSSTTPTAAIPTSISTISGAVVNAGGSGYAVNDILTVNGGSNVANTLPAELQVTSVGAGGAVTGVAILASQPGFYTTQPSNPASVIDKTNPAANGATFGLAFSSGSDGVVPAQIVQNDLNTLLATPGTPGYTSAVSHGTALVLSTGTANAFAVTFGGTLAGVNVPTLQAGNLLGTAFATVTVANTLSGFVSRTIQGGSAIAIPTQWNSIGPAPETGSPVFAGGPATLADVAGRVTGVAATGSDPNDVEISTAGGGAFETVNALSANPTWTPLFDGYSAIETVQIKGKTGTFAISFTNPTTGARAPRRRPCLTTPVRIKCKQR